MIRQLKEKIDNSITSIVREQKEKEYSKNDRRTLKDFDSLLRENISTALIQSNNNIKLLEKQIEKYGGKEEIEKLDDFLSKKIDESVEQLKKQVSKLKKLQRIQVFKIRDMYEAYSRLYKIQTLNATIKEYTFRVREENIIRIKKASQ